MKRKVVFSLTFVFVSALFLFSCAGFQKQVTLDEGQKENIVQMKASNFKFEPNDILTYKGNTVLFRIENTASAEHNFTLMDPSGTTLQDIDIPRGKTIEIKVTFSSVGIYHFYCDRLFHSALGMKGQIEVVRR